MFQFVIPFRHRITDFITLQHRVDGIAIEYLDLLEDKLGFKCSSLILYKEGNSTDFTAFIKHLERCSKNGTIRKHDPACACDIGVGGWSMNPDRLRRVDFVVPFLFTDYRALTHVENTNTSNHGTYFLTTFSLPVWFAIFSLVLIFTFLKMLDRRFAPPNQEYITPSPEISLFRRMRYYLLKNKLCRRIRHAFQSTRKLHNSALTLPN